MKKVLILIVVSLLLTVNQTYAHPGRTDANGGHTCLTNCLAWGLKDGEYHTHNSSGGYTNAEGDVFDSQGNLIAPAPEPEPTPPPPPEPTPTSEPVIVPKVITTTPPPRTNVAPEIEAVTETELAVEPDPEPAVLEVPEETRPESDDSDEGSTAGAVVVLAGIGGAGYYAVRKMRRKKK